MIIQAELAFPPSSVLYLPEDAKNLITKFLNKKPADRMKLSELAKHPFIRRNMEHIDEDNLDIFECMKRVSL
jgi:hypothetical protein